MKKKFLSMISEKDGKISAKRVAGLFASLMFFEIVQVTIWFSVARQKDISNQAVILKALELSFIVIATALVGIAAPTLAGVIKGGIPFLGNSNVNTEEETKE